ncbi:MAG: MopE-related protein [Myxococcota bacterium]
MRHAPSLPGSMTHTRSIRTITGAALPLFLAIACTPVTIVFDDKGSGDDTGGDIDTVVDGALSVSPASFDFGVVFVGGTGAGVVTVENVGDGEIQLAAVIEGDASFTLVAPATSPGPGATADLALTFTPGDFGAFTADLVVTDASGDARIVVPLTGTAQIDADADGVGSLDSGGLDCDDADASAYPGATEVWYDGVDQDCAGGDDYDRDADGSSFDDDCDDDDATSFPGAEETWYDGLDQDCAGDDDFDQDQDGFRYGVDCDDLDAAINPNATDDWYDGIDSDCAGNDDNDQDADGSPVPDDCADEDPTSYPGARDAWYDGIDSDCAGNSDYDQDADGADYVDDCNDTDATVTGPVTETLDGADNDCDGVIDDVGIGDIASGLLYGPISSLGLGGAGNLSLGGDLDGDGGDDLVVASDSSSYGYAWVVSGATGATAGGSVRDYDTAEVTSSSGYYILGNVAGPLEDLTGDGTADLLVTGSSSYYYEGRGWLLAGGSTLSGSISTGSTYTARFEGDSGDDMLAWTVSGDLDGDGTPEIVTGCPTDNYLVDDGYYYDTYDTSAGNVGIFSSGAFTGSYDLYDADDQIGGSGASDYLGYSLLVADLDDDGYGDIMAGAYGLDDGASNAGGIYVFNGNTSLAWDDRADDAMDTRLLGSSSSQYLGSDPLAAPGDHDGDGTLDLALNNDTTGNVWLFWDAGSLSGSASVSTADVIISGTAGSFGISGGYASDLDGDGADEIYVGAYGDDTAGTDAGAVYRFEPGSGTTGAWTTANASALFLGTNAGDYLGAGLAAGGDADGDGREDLLLGATGSDGAAVGGGAVYVLLGE